MTIQEQDRERARKLYDDIRAVYKKHGGVEPGLLVWKKFTEDLGGLIFAHDDAVRADKRKKENEFKKEVLEISNETLAILKKTKAIPTVTADHQARAIELLQYLECYVDDDDDSVAVLAAALADAEKRGKND